MSKGIDVVMSNARGRVSSMNATSPTLHPLPRKPKPSLAIVIGKFSYLATVRDWQDLEGFFNPSMNFEAVHVVATGDNYKYTERRFGTVHVHPVRSALPLQDDSRFRRLNDFFTLMRATIELCRIVLIYDIDVIAQTYSTPLKFGLPVVFAARLFRKPSVLTLCNDYREAAALHPRYLRLASRFLWPLLFRNATGIRSKSESSANFAYDWGVDASKVHVIPNKERIDNFREAVSSADVEALIQKLDIPNLIRGSTVFLTVARLIRQKNIERMLEAFALALGTNERLAYLIVGRGPLLSHLQRRSMKLGIASRVRFLGHFPHSQLRVIYQLSDVLLFPTLYEGQPRVALEAMISELPIICSNYGSVCELVEDGKDGLWVDPSDPHDIAAAMTKLADDYDLRRALSQHPAFDAERFSVERVSALEARLYDHVLRVHRESAHDSETPERADRTLDPSYSKLDFDPAGKGSPER